MKKFRHLRKQLGEKMQFKVDVEGLPPTFMNGKSSAEILAKLRKIVKQPSMIKGVERQTDMEVRRAYKNKAQGREMDEKTDQWYDDQPEWGTDKSTKKAKKMTPMEGSETWEAGYKRRVVKTTKPEHKEKGYNWRIKGKDRPEISIKLYKEKPSQAEFNKQMKRVAGHEFGG